MDCIYDTMNIFYDKLGDKNTIRQTKKNKCWHTIRNWSYELENLLRTFFDFNEEETK